MEHKLYLPAPTVGAPRAEYMPQVHFYSGCFECTAATPTYGVPTRLPPPTPSSHIFSEWDTTPRSVKALAGQSSPNTPTCLCPLEGSDCPTPTSLTEGKVPTTHKIGWKKQNATGLSFLMSGHYATMWTPGLTHAGNPFAPAPTSRSCWD